MLETKLAAHFESIILPFYKTLFFGSFQGCGGVELKYACKGSENKKGTIVIVEGRAEFLTKYAEIFHDLQDSGYALYIYDHRGQGFSGRLLADHRKGHVENFNDYVSDLNRFLKQIVFPEKPAKVFFLCHSMGGAITVQHELQYPGLNSGIILSAPLLAVRFGSAFVEKTAFWLAKSACRLGMAKNYVPGGGNYNLYPEFDKNILTTSQVRYGVLKKLVSLNPEVVLSGPTFRWAREAVTACRQIAGKAAMIRTPILLLQAEKDSLVSAAAQCDFARQAENCRLIRLRDARHELLMEKDIIRRQVMKEIMNFIDY